MIALAPLVLCPSLGWYLKLRLYVIPVAQLRLCRLAWRGFVVWRVDPEAHPTFEEWVCSFPDGKQELLRIESWVREKLGWPRYEGRLAA